MSKPKTDSGRIVAFDLGKARIGVAVSDPLGLTAQPVDTIAIRSPNEVINRLKEAVRKYEAGTIVLGMPLNMDGTEGEQARWVRWIGEDLDRRLKEVRVVFWDERLTSIASESVLVESGMRNPKRKLHRDRIAAALILQAYLESRRAQPAD